MEFDGQLSYNDILNMTQKELSILQAHRRKYGKGYNSERQLMKQLAGVVQAQPAPPPNPNQPPAIPGKYNYNMQ